MATAAWPRVMLVDDDATLRRLVAMMLEELPITLLCCEGVASALAELRREPVQLLITDWMMPGASGLDLLQTLAGQPALLGTARLVVFSAGLDGVATAQLAALGVWRTLAKPVSLHQMESCVRDGLGWLDAEALRRGVEQCVRQDAPQGAETAAQAEARAIQQHFAGQAGLFQAFKADCLQQFQQDALAGDVALAAADLPALRRLAHTLKSVLRMLGHEGLALQALQLEEAATSSNMPAAAALWPELRRHCLALGA